MTRPTFAAVYNAEFLRDTLVIECTHATLQNGGYSTCAKAIVDISEDEVLDELMAVLQGEKRKRATAALDREIKRLEEAAEIADRRYTEAARDSDRAYERRAEAHRILEGAQAARAKRP